MTAIVCLGAAGFAFSYDALREMALAIHAHPLLSYVFPVFIDGFIAYGVRALVLLRYSHFGARLYAWFLFLSATGASIWANVLHAVTLNRTAPSDPSALYLGDTAVGVLSVLAPLALGGSVHLFIVVSRTGEQAVADRSETGRGPVHGARANDGTGVRVASPVPDGRRSRSGTAGGADAARRTVEGSADQPPPGFPAAAEPVPDNFADGADRPSADREDPESPVRDRTAPPVPNGPPSPHPAVAGSFSAEAPEGPPSEDSDPAPVPDGRSASDRRLVDEGLLELLPLAQEAARRAGRVSRSVVADAVRAHQPISNDRLGELLALLREMEDGTGRPPVKVAEGPSSLW
ncbi:DUF2637 domain-containing protein [Streptomyces tsukubensis]|uniref:DUF2637 domain-containing protein n=1 Tax=Streptomyces tsukubensis TaxID=83656 RepID=UPI0036BD1E3B